MILSYLIKIIKYLYIFLTTYHFIATNNITSIITIIIVSICSNYCWINLEFNNVIKPKD